MTIGSTIPFRRNDDRGRTGSLLLDRGRDMRVREERRELAQKDGMKVWSSGHFRRG